MKTERELFEEWFPLKHLFNYLYWSEEQKNYVYNQYDEEHCRAYEYVNSSWSAWCASAQRDDYKLVPVEPTRKMEMAGMNAGAGFVSRSIYKAMIGAAP